MTAQERHAASAASGICKTQQHNIPGDWGDPLGCLITRTVQSAFLQLTCNLSLHFSEFEAPLCHILEWKLQIRWISTQAISSWSNTAPNGAPGQFQCPGSAQCHFRPGTSPRDGCHLHGSYGEVLLVAFLLLVVVPGATSSFLLLVAMPSVPGSFLFLVCVNQSAECNTRTSNMASPSMNCTGNERR